MPCVDPPWPCSPMQEVRGGVYPRRGNASKTRQASLPHTTVEQNRRELVAFCQQCWQFTNSSNSKGKIGILPLMMRLLIDNFRTAEHQLGPSRGELTRQDIQNYVSMCLKIGKSTGKNPDRCQNELKKTWTMMDEKFQIVKMWMNGILTKDTSRQRATMNGAISQLLKDRGTNEMLDQRPVGS